MEVFRSATRTWFKESFEAPTPVQSRGWKAISSGGNVLLAAPTGSGKTLAAFLWAIDALAALPPDAEPGVRVVYVSPLKALVYDIERNLRAPLAGIQNAAENEGGTLRPLGIDVRTGDTPQRERQRQARSPAEILVTTPESLFLILGSRQASTLRTVTTIIVDEIHALAPSKRGAHLALSLERLSELAEREPQRIGLSATVRPLDEVARFLGGHRPVDVVDASESPHIDLSIVVPVPDMQNVPPPSVEKDGGGSSLGELYHHQVGGPAGERGLWPAIYPRLLEAIEAHRSTIVFVNNRGLCERLAQRLNSLADAEIALSHHGSVSHEKRVEIENGLKQGQIKAIVATSSLELGIDMGAVDLVILVESPGSVARGLQRVGRAGHSVGAVSKGWMFPKFRGDLLETAVVAARMAEGAIEALRIPRNCLDVLAQQLVAICLDRPRSVEELETLVRRSYTYAELAPDALRSVLDMLSGRYPSQDFADLRPRLRWDRAKDELSARPGAAMVSRMNAGTIPDRGHFAVHLGEDGPRVGELDEEMVYETRDGDTFLLGATTWRVEAITKDRVVVSPAPGEPGRLPFWKGDGPGRPLELGRALGAFVREVGELAPEETVSYLRARLPLDEFAAGNLAAYVHEQKEATGTLPTDRSITVERFRDELGDWRVCILSPFGSAVNAPWAMAIERRLSQRAGIEVQLMYTDDGIVLRFADVEELPALDELLPDPDEVEELITEAVGGTSLFASLFRENAVRSLLVTRRRPQERSPLWLQRLKAKSLLATVQRYPNFPVVLETYRNILSDVFDLRGLREILGDIRSRKLAVREVETRSASPFARSLVFAYVAAYLYDGDSPAAERKAQALTLDQNLLRELLGQGELRELLDTEVMEELERELQFLAEDRRAKNRDELADLLRRLGDLTAEEAAARSVEDPLPWLEALEEERRAIPVLIADERRWIAADEAGLYRDALGCATPGDLPTDFLDLTERPLETLLRRFARTHAPFTSAAAAQRFALLPAQLEPQLRLLEQAGVLVHGELRPQGTLPEWCDTEILRRIKRRTLARLRDEVAPVDAAALARFLPRWHGLVASRSMGERVVRGGAERLLEVVAQLEGLPLPWSALFGELLPARVPDFRPELIDQLSAEGAVVWVGRGSLGPNDGRIALYRRESVAELLPPSEDFEPPSELHRAIHDHLGERGACFLTEVERALLKALPEATRQELEHALWDLVWAGVVTNDTFQPLRTLRKSSSRGSPSTRGRARRARVLSGGRWSLVRELRDESAGDDTRRTLATARVLLERYGVVSREAAAAEDLPGGFGPLYRVLRSMEEAGQVRRGYFVEGLSGAQFARPGVVDRLRDERKDKNHVEDRDSRVRRLAALDPANPWGALLAWPETGGEARPRRVAGADVLSVEGRLLLYVAPGARQILTFPAFSRDETDLSSALRALARLPRRGRRLLSIEKIDGRPAEESPHAELMLRSGFVRDYRGFLADPHAAAAASEEDERARG